MCIQTIQKLHSNCIQTKRSCACEIIPVGKGLRFTYAVTIVKWNLCALGTQQFALGTQQFSSFRILAESDIYLMFIEPMITGFHQGSLGTYGLVQKLC